MNNDKMIAHVTAQLNLAAQLQAEDRKPQMIAVLLQDALFAQERLEFEEVCLSPHRSGMPILTATLTQVRDPILTGAVSAWQHYEPWLTPYVDDLRSA